MISRRFPQIALSQKVSAAFQYRYAHDPLVQSALAVLKKLGIKKGSRITDVGPNSLINFAIASQGLNAHYTAFDTDADTVRWVHRELQFEERSLPARFQNLRFVAGEFSSELTSKSRSGSYRLRDRSQDCVLILSGVLKGPLAGSILKEVLRVIKPGGKIVMRSAEANEASEMILESSAWKDKVKLHLEGDVEIPNNSGYIFEVEFLG